MALPVTAVEPGWSSGPIHLVDDPNRWASGRADREVLGLPGLWWPPVHGLPPEACAVVLLGFPPARGPSTGFPVIAGVDPDILREGETVEVNGSKGTLTIPGVTEVRVITAFLERDDGRILLLQRSEKVGSFRGRWAGVSGFLEDPTPLDQAYREVREEVGIAPEALRLEADGAPVFARDGASVFVVYPFLFRTATTELRLDWEHTRAEWVPPEEIRRRPTVPKLDRVWEVVTAARVTKG